MWTGIGRTYIEKLNAVCKFYVFIAPGTPPRKIMYPFILKFPTFFLQMQNCFMGLTVPFWTKWSHEFFLYACLIWKRWWLIQCCKTDFCMNDRVGASLCLCLILRPFSVQRAELCESVTGHQCSLQEKFYSSPLPVGRQGFQTPSCFCLPSAGSLVHTAPQLAVFFCPSQLLANQTQVLILATWGLNKWMVVSVHVFLDFKNKSAT